MFLKKGHETVERIGDPVSRTFGEGPSGGGGILKFLTRGESVAQSVCSHVRRQARAGDGEASHIVIGTWSEPVEGRDVSYPLTKGKSRGLANARWITDGRAFPERGNLVYTPGEFSRTKPPNAANSKYRADEDTA